MDKPRGRKIERPDTVSPSVKNSAEVSMWSSRASQTQSLIREKGLETEKIAMDVTEKRDAILKQSLQTLSSVSAVANRLKTTVEGNLIALGAETTSSIMVELTDMRAAILEVRELISSTFEGHQRLRSAFEELIRLHTEFSSQLMSRGAAMEKEYRKLQDITEGQETFLSKVRTYVKTIISERLAWQEQYGANPLKLIAYTDDFNSHCLQALGILEEARQSRVMAVLDALDPNKVASQFAARAADGMATGSILLRYVTPQEELQLLSEMLQDSSSDSKLMRQLAIRERRFANATKETFERCEVVRKRIRDLKAALQLSKKSIANLCSEKTFSDLRQSFLDVVAQFTVHWLPFTADDDDSSRSSRSNSRSISARSSVSSQSGSRGSLSSSHRSSLGRQTKVRFKSSDSLQGYGRQAENVAQHDVDLMQRTEEVSVSTSFELQAADQAKDDRTSPQALSNSAGVTPSSRARRQLVSFREESLSGDSTPANEPLPPQHAEVAAPPVVVPPSQEGISPDGETTDSPIFDTMGFLMKPSFDGGAGRIEDPLTAAPRPTAIPPDIQGLFDGMENIALRPQYEHYGIAKQERFQRYTSELLRRALEFTERLEKKIPAVSSRMENPLKPLAIQSIPKEHENRVGAVVGVGVALPQVNRQLSAGMGTARNSARQTLMPRRPPQSAPGRVREAKNTFDLPNAGYAIGVVLGLHPAT